MAEKLNSDNGEDAQSEALTHALKRLDEETTCAVCHERYSDPKFLPNCRHYYCRKCIERIVRYSQSSRASCPLCGKDIVLPPEGVKSLQPAYFVGNLLDLLGAIDANKTELLQREITCDVCHASHAQLHCRECRHFMCRGCSESHRSVSQFSRHRLLTLEELERLRAADGLNRSDSVLTRSDSYFRSDSNVSNISSGVFRSGLPASTSFSEKKLRMCPQHDDPIKVYCADCRKLICRDCALYEHKDHNHSLIQSSAPTTRQGLFEALKPLEDIRKDTTTAKEVVDNLETQVEAQLEGLSVATRNTFDQMRTQLDECEVQSLHKLSRLAQKKKQLLVAKSGELTSVLQDVDKTLSHIQSDIHTASNEDILIHQYGWHDQIGEKIMEHCNPRLEPPTVADMVSEPPSPDTITANHGMVFAMSDLRDLHLRPPSACTVGETTQYVAKIPKSLQGDLELTLVSLVNPTCHIIVEVVYLHEKVLRGIVFDEYQVSFTPVIRGRHELRVKIRGTQLPLVIKFFVRFNPVFLSAPIRRGPEMRKPFALLFDQNGDLIVAENISKVITTLNRKLEPTGHVICHAMFHYPRGMLLGPDGSLYISDKSIGQTHKTRCYTIMKFDKDGNFVDGVLEGSLCVFMIRLIKNQIFACDKKMWRIHILSLDLVLQTSFSTSKTPEPHDIIEHNGSLYVVGGADRGGVVSIYTMQGTYMGNIPLQVESLCALKAICFDKAGNMFLTSGHAGWKNPTKTGKEGVYVFKTTGEFVTHFANNYMDYPLGIVIDEDGFVYVGDHVNAGRVMMF